MPALVRVIALGLTLPVAPALAIGPAAWSGGATGVAQTTTDPALADALTASIDLVGALTLGPGDLVLYLEGASTVRPDSVAARVPESNADAGSALDRDGRGRVQLSEFKYALAFAGGQELTAGLIDLPSYLDQSRIASDENTQFLGTNFVQNPTIAFPDYVPGLVLARVAEPGAPGFSLVAAASQGLGDGPDRSYREVFDLFDDGRGAFLAAAGGWAGAGRLTRVGAWYRSDPQPRLDGAGRGHGYGLYLVHGDHAAGGRFNLRAGWADPSTVLASGFLGASWQRAWPDWVLGLGLCATRASSDARAADGLNAEVYLRYHLGLGGYLTPSLQYFHNPGLDDSGAAADRDLGVANLRLSWLW